MKTSNPGHNARTERYSSFRSGQFDFNFEALGRPIMALDGSAAGFDAGADNRQAQPHAARFPLARILRAIKGFEHRFDLGLRNTRTLVGDEDENRAALLLRRNHDGAAVPRVTNGVAHQIGEGAKKVFGISHHFRVLIHLSFNARPPAPFPIENTPDRLRHIHVVKA